MTYAAQSNSMTDDALVYYMDEQYSYKKEKKQAQRRAATDRLAAKLELTKQLLTF